MRGYFHRKSVLVTGGTGFIGKHLVNSLLEQDAAITVLSRHPPRDNGQKYKTLVGDLMCPATLENICHGVDIVFHLGGYAHAVDQSDGESEINHMRVTMEGTRALLAESLKARVSRFLFFSSVKAMGEGGEGCLDETTLCRPVTSYGKSRLEAEELVREAGRQGLSSTVLRLPMVYGPGCKGNLPRMIKAIMRGHFPPLPESGNRRSMVDVRDVVQAALLAAMNQTAKGKLYIVTDCQTYSTRQIYEWICAVLDRSVPRWTISLSLLHFVARAGDMITRLSGRRFIIDTDAMDKLIGSAWYSSEKICRELNYRPAYTLENSLPEMVAEFGNLS